MNETESMLWTLISLWFGAVFGALMAYVAVETPHPLPLLPRVLGWVFFVPLCSFCGYAIRKAS